MAPPTAPPVSLAGTFTNVIEDLKRIPRPVLIMVFFLVISFVFTLLGGSNSAKSTNTSSTDQWQLRGDIFDSDRLEGKTLHAQITTTTTAAMAAGLVNQMPTTIKLVNGWGAKERNGKAMDFLLSVVDPKYAASKKAKTTLGANATAPKSYDPFDKSQRDIRMQVAMIPPTHALLLNKFPTLLGHSLIVTEEFAPQTSGLSYVDFVSWYRLVTAVPAIGFYNFGVASGASQKHKHTQIIPLDVLRAVRVKSTLPQSGWSFGGGGVGDAAVNSVPVEDLIETKKKEFKLQLEVGTAAVTAAQVVTLDELPFLHALILLPPPPPASSVEQGGRTYYFALLYETLQSILTKLDLHRGGGDAESAMHGGGSTSHDGTDCPDCTPYNIIMACDWILVVPRSQHGYLNTHVNGMGFIGALLVHDEATADVVMEQGPMEVLKGVTFPASLSPLR